ncbi:hypothetical protein A4X13_0g4179 [Tilletia indica]|uniref:Uncharacterized protein n=1 Tax=Tilletia indica TaxID=43049 RepID=A0A177TPU5_9BASI|nr:hypothetical protein A4X13_0g4179 [Tilletia indica]
MSSSKNTLNTFTCAVLTGAGGGLGKAMATYLHSQGKKVILVGRTESNLREVSAELDNSPYYVFDTGKVEEAPAFAKRVIKEHPEVDSLWNNAGVQRTLDVHELDLSKADQEIDINVRGPIHLATAFLPHFKSRPSALIVNVSSVLGICPFSIINPVYNGTKAFLHFWSMAQRTQLKNTSVKVVEILPPSVGTDLHRDRENPDDNKPEKGAKNSISVEDFMKDVQEGLAAGQDVISAGMGKGMVDKWYQTLGEQFQGAADAYQPK